VPTMLSRMKLVRTEREATAHAVHPKDIASARRSAAVLPARVSAGTADWSPVSMKPRPPNQEELFECTLTCVPMARDNELRSGFLNHDYLLTFEIADAAKRDQLVALCEGDWLGDRVTATTWEVSTKLSPDSIEKTLLEILGENDRATYYYLSDSKRIFRVVLKG